MPKKSNKTDHVLNLLTNGRADDDTAKKQSTVQPLTGASSIAPAKSAGEQVSFNIESSAPARRVVVEEANMRENLSQLVRQGLEAEIGTQKLNEKGAKPFIILDESDADAKVTQVFSEEDMEYVSSRPYILEDFNESGDTNMENNNLNLSSDITKDFSDRPDEFLHNVAEDIMISKAPAIMESMNMCTCKNCVYDVVALALNNTKPMYTVTKKGELFQKLASIESQCGTDIARELTRACIQIKMNPRHAVTGE